MAGLIRSPLVTNLDSRISILCWLMEVLGRKGLKWRLPWNGNSRKGLKLRLLPVLFFCCFKDRRNNMHNESKACADSLRMLSLFWVYQKKKRKKLFFSHFVIFGVGLKLKCILMMKYEVNILESFLFCQSRKIIYIYIYNKVVLFIS